MAAFPNEVLMLIFSWLEFSLAIDEIPWIPKGTQGEDSPLPYQPLSAAEHENYRTLASICRASKQLQALAQPLLYHTLLIQKYEDSEPLLRTLSKSPRLCGMVYTLYLHLHPVQQDVFGRRLRALFDEACSQPQVSSNAAPILPGILNFICDTFCHETAVMFWLSLLPNVKILSLATPQGRYGFCPLLYSPSWGSLAISSTPLPGNQHFSSLQEAPPQPELGDDIGEDTVDMLAPDIMVLPSEESLRTWKMSCIDYIVDQDLRFRGSLKRLHELHCGHLKIRPDVLENLLSHCQDLRRLYLDIPLDNVGGSRLDLHPSCYEVGDLLRAQKNLQHVRLSFKSSDLYSRQDRHLGRYMPGDEYLARNIGSLKGLTQLWRFVLQLPIPVRSRGLRPDPVPVPPRLYLSEMLPSSLEALSLDCLFGNQEGMEADFCHLANTRRESFPHLRYVNAPHLMPTAARFEADEEWTPVFIKRRRRG